MIELDVMQVQKGDIVRFSGYAIRVESEPVGTSNAITLHGRASTDGCPLVTKKFITGRIVKVERASA